MLTIAALLLASCGNNSGSVKEDRQFANNAAPSTQLEPTSAPSPTIATGPTGPIPASASPETLLSARGAPAWMFADLKGTLFAIEPGSASRRPNLLKLPDGQHLVAYDASPGGDQVAVVTAADAPEANGDLPISLLVYGHDGKRVGDSRKLFVLPPGTPVPGIASPVTGTAPIPSALATVAWSAQGDQILVSSTDGQLSTVPVRGEPHALAIKGIRGTVVRAAWSPRGESLSLLVRDAEGFGSIAIATPKQGAASIQTIWPRSDEAHKKSVDEATWLPDGSGVMFTQSAMRDGVPVEAQLFELALDGSAPRLVATAGRAGPAAKIASFAVSPDGKSVAYTIARPNGNGWAFHSLWVRSIRGQAVYPVPANAVISVSGLGWSRAGLVWTQTSQDDAGDTSEELMLAGHDATVTILAKTKPAAASPVPAVASPEATPEASPA